MRHTSPDFSIGFTLTNFILMGKQRCYLKSVAALWHESTDVDFNTWGSDFTATSYKFCTRLQFPCDVFDYNKHD